MTDPEAKALAIRIINTWNGGPKLNEWIDALTGLDAGTAGTAYVRLRANSEHAPSIARFIATCRAVHPHHPDTQPSWNGPPIGRDDPRAIAAFKNGYRDGKAELAALAAQSDERAIDDGQRPIVPIVGPDGEPSFDYHVIPIDPDWEAKRNNGRTA